jgi:hypothetical protein
MDPTTMSGFDQCRGIRCREDDRFDIDKATRWVIANRSWPMEGVDADKALADHALAICAARTSADVKRHQKLTRWRHLKLTHPQWFNHGWNLSDE